MAATIKNSRFRSLAALFLSLAAVAPAQAQDNWGASAPKRNGKYAEVNGIRLYYEVTGTGKPLVLLHGGLGAIEMFGPNLNILGQGRQLIAVDLQGHGRTADIDRPFSLQSMADDIAALLKHLNIPRADLMGYSLGGAVAMQAAVRHPQLVDRLILVSTMVRTNAYHAEIRAQQGQVNAAAAEFMKETPMYKLYTSIAPRPQDFPRLLDKIGAFMKNDLDLTNEFKKITAPTLIVAGDSDIFPPSHAVEMFALLGGGLKDAGWDGSGLPKSQLSIIPGASHYNIFSDTRVAGIANAFLARPAASDN